MMVVKTRHWYQCCFWAIGGSLANRITTYLSVASRVAYRRVARPAVLSSEAGVDQHGVTLAADHPDSGWGLGRLALADRRSLDAPLVRTANASRCNGLEITASFSVIRKVQAGRDRLVLLIVTAGNVDCDCGCIVGSLPC